MAKIGRITLQMALSREIESSVLKITGQIIKTKIHPVEHQIQTQTNDATNFATWSNCVVKLNTVVVSKAKTRLPGRHFCTEQNRFQREVTTWGFKGCKNICRKFQSITTLFAEHLTFLSSLPSFLFSVLSPPSFPSSLLFRIRNIAFYHKGSIVC